jgi:hypothetical protein
MEAAFRALEREIDVEIREGIRRLAERQSSAGKWPGELLQAA